MKPYLELLRLIRRMGTLKFDELQMFGMQLTDWHNFENIVQKIESFRNAKANHRGSYKSFKANYLRSELMLIFKDRITSGETQTRESNDTSLEKFIRTQSSNMRDYADACFRYLRATGLVNVSHIGKSLSIVAERIEDVDYILHTIDRNPCFVDDEQNYVAYLGNATLPQLLTDNKQLLIKKLHTEFPLAEFDYDANMTTLKDLFSDLTERRKAESLHKLTKEIKDYKLYEEIQDTFKRIERNELYDAPLMLEWNTWRAMTMLDGGDIKANFSFDDFGKPLSTAQGNMADIVCDYGDYLLTVEVTMASGQRQYEMESEPVSRHLGKLKKESGKPCYSLFIAPTINDACIAHFYALHNMNISYYGGKSVIIPLPLKIFQKMIEDSYKANSTPTPTHVRNFFERSQALIRTCQDETQWYEKIQQLAANWMEPHHDQV